MKNVDSRTVVAEILRALPVPGSLPGTHRRTDGWGPRPNGQ
jgi:hypothetical protein